MDAISITLVIVLTIYALFITYLYYAEVKNRDDYLKDKVEYINSKNLELNKREKEVLGKEQCMRNFTKVKTVNEAAVKILQSYQSDLAQS